MKKEKPDDHEGEIGHFPFIINFILYYQAQTYIYVQVRVLADISPEMYRLSLHFSLFCLLKRQKWNIRQWKYWQKNLYSAALNSNEV